MKKLKMKVVVNNKVVFNKEDSHVFGDALKAARQGLYPNWGNIFGIKKGQKGAVTVKMSWECTMDGRAPRRAPDVIAAEKAARSVKSHARKLRNEQYAKAAEQLIVNLRKRVKSQVDHAFSSGKSGTESASKYITCQDCEAPAVFLVLSQEIARGAAVLDEDTITGAVCAEHNYAGWGRKLITVPCFRLEFFYDGVRQIGIKP
jgi:hypothetical protein